MNFTNYVHIKDIEQLRKDCDSAMANIHLSIDALKMTAINQVRNRKGWFGRRPNKNRSDKEIWDYLDSGDAIWDDAYMKMQVGIWKIETNDISHVTACYPLMGQGDIYLSHQTMEIIQKYKNKEQ